MTLGDVETCIGSIDIVIGVLSPRCFIFFLSFFFSSSIFVSAGVDSTEKFSGRMIKISWKAVMI